MKKIISNKKCTGCLACKNSCPKNAISTIKHQDGFLYPKIDQEKCIDCKMCKKTCPVLNYKSNNAINKCYVGYSMDKKEKLNSSSGGIFPLLANYVLNNDGIVIGASFSNNVLKHIVISKKEELVKLQGSKYLQSNIDEIYKYILKNIKYKKILFVGLPCQVAGVRAFLKKDFENLILVDLVCHGVPSPKIFNKYISELEQKENDKLVNYIFRDKSTGWETYSNTAIFKTKKITELQKNNKYMKIFLSDVALRKSCFNCNFKLGNKYSDITLGDFWGVENYYKDMYDKNGVSAIIINSTKGEKIFNEIKKSMNYKECKLQEIMSGNPSLYKSVDYNKNNDKFLKNIDDYSFDDLVSRYAYKKRTISKKIFNKINKIKLLIKNEKM